VLSTERGLDPEKTLYIVSTKSGGTVETLSLFKYYFNSVRKALGPEEAGRHFIAITDPGSALEAMAGELGFARTFLNDPNIGGRYSALSFFGLVPAACIGASPERLLASASEMAGRTRSDEAPLEGPDNPLMLGIILGVLARAGRDKLTLALSEDLRPFGAWVEQLIAESTGKEGRGILPVDGETLAAPRSYGDDRVFVRLLLGDDGGEEVFGELRQAGHPVIEVRLNDLYDLGGEIFRWEVATACAGCILEVNPFDQPNVESAKVSARKMVQAYQRDGALPEGSPALESGGIRVFGKTGAPDPETALRAFVDAGGSYVALQAFLEPTERTWTALQGLRTAVRDRTGLATTAGYGPRFLHSTGQLHKGDAGQGLFVQFTADAAGDAPIPDGPGGEESSMTFGVLKSSQALGDRSALVDGGRRVLAFHLGADPFGGLSRLTEGLRRS
jgi:hypothetical protein